VKLLIFIAINEKTRSCSVFVWLLVAFAFVLFSIASVQQGSFFLSSQPRRSCQQSLSVVDAFWNLLIECGFPAKTLAQLFNDAPTLQPFKTTALFSILVAVLALPAAYAGRVFLQTVTIMGALFY
jgi:hypothetical protein